MPLVRISEKNYRIATAQHSVWVIHMDSLMANCITTQSLAKQNGAHMTRVHYSDIIMGSMASQITSLAIVY